MAVAATNRTGGQTSTWARQKKRGPFRRLTRPVALPHTFAVDSCVTCYATRRSTCTHNTVCRVAESLVYRACVNTVKTVPTGTTIREVLKVIKGETGPLNNALLTLDPAARFDFPKEYLSLLDASVPASLLTKMKLAGLVDDVNLKCCFCHENASILHVPCAACDEVAHPACIGLQVDSKEELVRLLTQRGGKWLCTAEHEGFVAPTVVDNAPKCFACGLGVGGLSVQCCAPDCDAIGHFECLHFQFKGRGAKKDKEDLMQNGRFVCTKDATPLFVGVPDEDFNVVDIVETAMAAMAAIEEEEDDNDGLIPNFKIQGLHEKRVAVTTARQKLGRELTDFMGCLPYFQQLDPTGLVDLDEVQAKLLLQSFFNKAFSVDPSFEVRLSHGGVLGIDALRYLTETPCATLGDNVTMFRAVLRATLGEQSGQSGQSGQSLDQMYSTFCAQHNVPPLSALAAVIDLHQLLTSQKYADLMAQRDGEYDEHTALINYRTDHFIAFFEAVKEAGFMHIHEEELQKYLATRGR